MNAYVAYKVSTRVGKSVDWLGSSWLTMGPVSHCCPCLFLQTSLAMFRCKAFTVRRRYSDFLGLHEKLAVKQSLQGCIIPSPPEKSVVGACPLSTCMFFRCWSLVYLLSVQSTGMTKVKVGMDDPASVEFVERRRAGLERQVQMFSLLRFTSFVPHLFISVQVSSENRVSPVIITRSRCARILRERRCGCINTCSDVFL